VAVGYPTWKSLDGCCQEPRVPPRVSDPGCNRAWEYAESAESGDSDDGSCQHVSIRNAEMLVGVGVGEMFPLVEVVE
jgi:hypothetical protein